MTSFDDELEAEVQRAMVPPGEESRRRAAVSSLHQATPTGVALRLAGVTLTIALVTGMYYALGGTLALQALTDVCRAAGLCS
jgi:hypothetical protein